LCPKLLTWLCLNNRQVQVADQPSRAADCLCFLLCPTSSNQYPPVNASTLRLPEARFTRACSSQPHSPTPISFPLPLPAGGKPHPSRAAGCLCFLVCPTCSNQHPPVIASTLCKGTTKCLNFEMHKLCIIIMQMHNPSHSCIIVISFFLLSELNPRSRYIRVRLAEAMRFAKIAPAGFLHI
jgi:hypothetical protein